VRGNGDALLLPAGESGAVFADLGLVALRKFLDGVVDLASWQHGSPVRSWCGGGEDEVVVEGAGEQHGFLRNDAEVVAQFVAGQVSDVAAVDLMLPSCGW